MPNQPHRLGSKTVTQAVGMAPAHGSPNNQRQEISYEEWIIEERLRLKTGKGRRAILTEDIRSSHAVRRSPHEALLATASTDRGIFDRASGDIVQCKKDGLIWITEIRAQHSDSGLCLRNHY